MHIGLFSLKTIQSMAIYPKPISAWWEQLWQTVTQWSRKWLCNLRRHRVNIEIPDDVIKWKYLPGCWPFVQGIHQSPVNFPHKGQQHGALMFSLIRAWINGWVNNREAGDLRRHCTQYDVIVMWSFGHLQTEPVIWKASSWQWNIMFKHIAAQFYLYISIDSLLPVFVKSLHCLSLLSISEDD